MSTSVVGPAAGGFTVVPARLHAARGAQEAAAQVLAEVARAVGGLQVTTGRPDTQAACEELLRGLSASLRSAAEQAHRAGAAVAAAGTAYSAVDTTCLGGARCG